MRKAQRSSSWVRPGRFFWIAALLALLLTNPGFSTFFTYLGQQRSMHLKQEENLALEAADWLGRFEACRRNCLFFSIYTITYRSVILKKKPEGMIFIGFAGFFLPLGMLPVNEMKWLRSYKCRTYNM